MVDHSVAGVRGKYSILQTPDVVPEGQEELLGVPMSSQGVVQAT